MNAPRVFELVGVAGSGKTTFKNYILNNRLNVLSKPSIKRAVYFPIWIASAVEVLIFSCSGIFACKYSGPRTWTAKYLHGDRRYKYFEFKLLIILGVLTRVVEREVSRKSNGIVVLDQGPIYLIVALNVISSTYAKKNMRIVLNRSIDRYLRVLTRILYLDIPLHILQDRWKGRSDWENYEAVFGGESEIYEHHRDYETEYLKLITALKERGVQIITVSDPEFDMFEASKKLFKSDLTGAVNDKVDNLVLKE